MNLSAVGREVQAAQAHRYAWQEGWSEEHSRHFYYNQETKESSWDRPADLAWRRVPAPKQEL